MGSWLLLLHAAELFSSVIYVWCGFVWFCGYFVSLGALGLQQ